MIIDANHDADCFAVSNLSPINTAAAAGAEAYGSVQGQVQNAMKRQYEPVISICSPMACIRKKVSRFEAREGERERDQSIVENATAKLQPRTNCVLKRIFRKACLHARAGAQ